MMITTPDGLGHFAVIDTGRKVKPDNVVDLAEKRAMKEAAMDFRPFEDTIPTDFGGLTERREYTPEGMRTGMLLVIAGALVTAAAIVVIVSTFGG